MRPLSILICGLFALSLPALPAIGADTFEVNQKNKTFSTSKLKVKVGDTVVFKNDDPFFHNIFSLSETQSFDLGSYSHRQSRKVILTKEGKVEVECAIHPEMKMTIEVVK